MFKSPNKPCLFLIALFTGCTNTFANSTIYKCKNDQGTLVYQKSPCNTAETVTSWTPKESSKPLDQSSEDSSEKEKEAQQAVPTLSLKQNRGGHYLTEGSINEKPLMFVVDTGASYVSLPEFVAHNALIYCDNQTNVLTANGKTDACTAKIKKLTFGPFFVEDVAALIVPNLGQPLLGMNVLQMFKLSQNNGEMQISAQESPKPNQ